MLKKEDEVRRMLRIVEQNHAVHPIVSFVLEWVLGIRDHEDSDFVFRLIKEMDVVNKNNSPPN